MTTQPDTYVQTALQQLGLSPHEAAIYRACLGRGEATIMQLAKITRISRTTIYGIADELVKKGLFRFVQKGAHRIYSAEDPKKLEQLVTKSKLIADRKAAFYSSVIGTLAMQFSSTAHKPLVSYHEGQTEVRQIFEDMLVSEAAEVLFLGEAATIEQAVGEKYLRDVIKRRISIGMKARGIRTEPTEVDEPLYDVTSQNLRNLRYAPKGFVASMYIGIYNHTVFFISSIDESYGVQVESKDLSETMRSWYEVLWKASKPAKSTKKSSL
jgi:sugar-specific transcriptional regulator TrmB